MILPSQLQVFNDILVCPVQVMHIAAVTEITNRLLPGLQGLHVRFFPAIHKLPVHSLCEASLSGLAAVSLKCLLDSAVNGH